MIKRIIFQKQELLNEIEKSLNNRLNDISFGVIEKVIDFENIVIDTIELKCDCIDDGLKSGFIDDGLEELLHQITDYYIYRNKTIIIELTDLRKYISKLYNIEVTEVYDFFECNIFGEMTECLTFELV